MVRNSVIAAALLAATTFSTIASAEYPEKEILGVIMWGAGGGTDTVSRAVNDAAAEALGQPIKLSNKSGGGGAISTAYLDASHSDGYTLLYGAENPQLHGVLGVSEIDYLDFHPINIFGRGLAVISVPSSSPYLTLQDLLDEISENPSEVRMGSTGQSGLPSTIAAIISQAADFDVTPVNYGGEGPGLAEMMRGNVDFMPTAIASAAEGVASGDLRALAVFDTEENAVLPGVPAITDTLPGLDRFLPWGNFYGVYVQQDVPQEVITKLTDAYAKAAQEPDFVQLMQDRGNVMMNITGQEAVDFLTRWQQVTAWVLEDTGAAKVSPADLSISRP
ncbi:MAG: tripartite tricarboxylate transporter substrate binding protein [Litoreibacter sp.]